MRERERERGREKGGERWIERERERERARERKSDQGLRFREYGVGLGVYLVDEVRARLPLPSRRELRHPCRPSSRIRNSLPLGPYDWPMPRALWWSSP